MMLTLYENARIFTGTQHSAECFVVKDGLFAFAGKTADAKAAYPHAECIDLGGRFVCPGFNDSHMHLLELGCVLEQAQLQEHTASLADVLNAISAYAQDKPDEAWVLGRGWNHDYFSDVTRYPTRDDLDQICPDRPCLITRTCGHVAIANSMALKIAGIDNHASAVDGGCVCTDENGRPNGALEENAILLVSRCIPTPDREGIKRRILLAMQTVAGYGITSVQSDDFCALEVPFEEILAAYAELEAEGKMTVRVTEQCLLPEMALLDRFLAAGYHTGWGSDWFRIGPLKLLADGSLGARTALLRSPYADAQDTLGTAIYTQETLNELVLKAHSHGMQIAVHAIGDGAADAVLKAVENAQNICPRENMRHGIVHAQIFTQEQIKRAAKLNMHAYIQPIFLDYDTQIVFPRLGERALDAYPAQSLKTQGVTFSSGSDCPVEPCDVLRGIQCAVTRMPATRGGDAPYLPHEALTLTDALLSFTVMGAYPSFEEHKKGRIEADYLADFTVLGIDPYETAPEWIGKIPVVSTYAGGKRV